MAPVIQPNFVCETNWTVFQKDLSHAIKMCAKFPSSHPSKPDRLEFLRHLIYCGADPMMVMDLQGEDTTCMQRALEYGDAMTIQEIKNAMEEMTKRPPLIIVKDPDALKESEDDKKLPVALLFPGQGSQYVGMLADCKDLEPCKVLIEKATEILGYDILDICLNGPASKFESPKICEPAIFLANACAIEKLRLEKPGMLNRVQAAAGLSVGEYSACYFSGMMEFDVALRMVRTRADAITGELKKGPQATVSIAGLDIQVVKGLCEAAVNKAGPTEDGEESVCSVGQQLFPKGCTCAGTKKAVELLKIAAENAGAVQARMQKPAGGFHTSIMSNAGVKVSKGLRANVANQTFPKCDLYMNVSGSAQRAGTDPREINMDLTAQVSNTVLWEQCVQEMIKQGITEFYECGPMKQLKAMMKRINQDAWDNTHSVAV